MSITDISYNQEAKSLEIVIKFFTDDLEKVLEENSKLKLLLGTEREASISDSLLKSYLLVNFKIKQNNNQKLITYIGKESDKDYTFAYLELKDFSAETNFSLENTLLIELFESQSNKVHYKNANYSKSISFHRNLTQAEF